GRVASGMSGPRRPFDDDVVPQTGSARQSSSVRLQPDPGHVAQDFSPALPDADARTYAVNPAENVVLEASAGTGKTRVLVDRYVNLLAAGVDPEHILAITFTR